MKRFEDLVLKSQFEVAEKILKECFEQNKLNLITDLAYKNENFTFYTYLISRLLKEETTWLHRAVISLFVVALCVFEGAEPIGLYHAKRGVELDNLDIGLKQLVLSYYIDVPQSLLTKEDAKKVIKEILALDQKNSYALEALEEYEDNAIKEIIIDFQDFYSLLYYGKFKEAQELVKEFTFDQLFELLTDINRKKPTLITYGYLISLLLEHEAAELHYLASHILIEQLNSMEGAYASGFWHAKKAVELDPANVAYKEHLLKFYVLPGQLLGKNEAMRLAKEILAIDPNNMSVFRIFDESDITT